ncbi:hypothetical protein H5968_09610 [Sphaerospermopsis sp. LEGE 00249]|nr:hypothetical protein [Sphaerospermopsis sp. LEGE 00249]MBC5795399.1 hypothetical protein [Sphaerospermopsis sp. LEGE 00249]
MYRRNKIAHEADIDPTFGLGNRWPIDELMVGDAVLNQSLTVFIKFYNLR